MNTLKLFSKFALLEKIDTFCADLLENFSMQMEFRKKSIVSLLIFCAISVNLVATDYDPIHGSIYDFFGVEFRQQKHLQTAPKPSKLLTKKELKHIEPYLLPAHHKAKDALDAIFSASRASLNMESFLNADFCILSSRPRSFVHVASHHLLPGYLVKVHFDQDIRKKWKKSALTWFKHRCEGAKKIKSVIKKKKIKHFVVADKWIYLLPKDPPPPIKSAAFDPKPAILLVSDMQLASYQESVRAWKTKMTKEHLDELYLISQLAGGDSYRPDNIAWTKQGKFAFIDTEYPQRRPNLAKLEHYLSEEMRDYWRHITGSLAKN